MSERPTSDKAERAPSSQAVELAARLASQLPPTLLTAEQRQQCVDAWSPIIDAELSKAFSRGVDESLENC
jgi:hypothetical protein